jgi:hypothetical protein
MLARMRSRRPSSQMTPLGAVLPDQEAIDAIERWMAHIRRWRSSEHERGVATARPAALSGLFPAC